MSKLTDSVLPLKHIITEKTIMAIDPSSGSRESQPGYAIFKAGQFVDSGIIKIPMGELHSRLFHLRKTLCEQFEKPDVLITENIPPVMLGQGKFLNRSMLSLQKSIGVVISCYDCPLIEVAPISWRKFIPENYVKSDNNDALMMAITVLKVATDNEWETPAIVLQRLATDRWG